MGLGRCVKCGGEVKVLYVKTKGSFKPFLLYCECGVEKQKTVMVYKSGYAALDYFKVEVVNGKVKRTPAPITLPFNPLQA